MSNKRPIGVFDSGLGGLTVLSALRKSLPNEDFIYLGDTARVPYGSKSPRIIERYSKEVAKFLISRNTKMIVIACNTATAHGEKIIKENFNVPVIGVIQPGVKALLKSTKNQRVGIIATRSTIKSGAYSKAIKQHSPKLQVFTKACPLFVPLVEEGWTEKRITSLIIQEYLSEMQREEVDTIVLGCTHYPLLKTSIQNEFPKFQLIDSSEEIALAVTKELIQSKIEKSSINQIPDKSNFSKQKSTTNSSDKNDELGSLSQNKGKVEVYLTDITDQMNHLETLLSGMDIAKIEEIKL